MSVYGKIQKCTHVATTCGCSPFKASSSSTGSIGGSSSKCDVRNNSDAANGNGRVVDCNSPRCSSSSRGSHSRHNNGHLSSTGETCHDSGGNSRVFLRSLAKESPEVLLEEQDTISAVVNTPYASHPSSFSSSSSSLSSASLSGPHARLNAATAKLFSEYLEYLGSSYLDRLRTSLSQLGLTYRVSCGHLRYLSDSSSWGGRESGNAELDASSRCSRSRAGENAPVDAPSDCPCSSFSSSSSSRADEGCSLSAVERKKCSSVESSEAKAKKQSQAVSGAEEAYAGEVYGLVRCSNQQAAESGWSGGGNRGSCGKLVHLQRDASQPRIPTRVTDLVQPYEQLLFIRHGQTPGNVEGVFQGRSDVYPFNYLTQDGEDQARGAACQLLRILEASNQRVESTRKKQTCPSFPSSSSFVSSNVHSPSSDVARVRLSPPVSVQDLRADYSAQSATTARFVLPFHSLRVYIFSSPSSRAFDTAKVFVKALQLAQFGRLQQKTFAFDGEQGVDGTTRSSSSSSAGAATTITADNHEEEDDLLSRMPPEAFIVPLPSLYECCFGVLENRGGVSQGFDDTGYRHIYRLQNALVKPTGPVERQLRTRQLSPSAPSSDGSPSRCSSNHQEASFSRASHSLPEAPLRSATTADSSRTSPLSGAHDTCPTANAAESFAEVVLRAYQALQEIHAYVISTEQEERFLSCVRHSCSASSNTPLPTSSRITISTATTTDTAASSDALQGDVQRYEDEHKTTLLGYPSAASFGDPNLVVGSSSSSSSNSSNSSNSSSSSSISNSSNSSSNSSRSSSCNCSSSSSSSSLSCSSPVVVVVFAHSLIGHGLRTLLRARICANGQSDCVSSSLLCGSATSVAQEKQEHAERKTPDTAQRESEANSDCSPAAQLLSMISASSSSTTTTTPDGVTWCRSERVADNLAASDNPEICSPNSVCASVVTPEAPSSGPSLLSTCYSDVVPLCPRSATTPLLERSASAAVVETPERRQSIGDEWPCACDVETTIKFSGDYKLPNACPFLLWPTVGHSEGREMLDEGRTL